MTARVPDRLYIDKADRELYSDKTLVAEIFAQRENKDRFLFAMCLGFKHDVRRPLHTRDGFILVQTLHPEDEALMDVVAVHETGSAEVLANRAEVFRIAEEYAHAGIRLLHGEATSGQPGSFFKRLELELFGLLETVETD
jgi:hypothetical protein